MTVCRFQSLSKFCLMAKDFAPRPASRSALSADGPTKDDALRKLRTLAHTRLEAGAEIVPMEVSTGNPWVDLAGLLPDDELTREWMQILRENRKKANESEFVLPSNG